MKPCVWYDVDEKLPTEKGYYLAFKGMSMGDSDTETAYYYWDPKYAEWRDYESRNMSNTANVVYWCDADPAGWYDNLSMRPRRKISEAEIDAWRAVEQAIERYEVVRNLVKT
jgi:hypothetical protein